MNEWIKKSIALANSEAYLDKLHSVYPVSLAEEREIQKSVVDGLKKIFDARDNQKLIKALLLFQKFPIKDPYVAFLRRGKGNFIEKNPETVKRISEQIYSLGFDAMLKGISAPKEFNRQIGTLFRKWIPTIGIPLLAEKEFEAYEKICFLKGSDATLKRYAKSKLGYDIEKGIDLIAKAGKTYFFLGEAKFLTDYGGHQMAQFEDALRMAAFRKNNCFGMAILDGVVWIEANNKMHNKVSESNQFILSALFLKEFLEKVHIEGISN